MNTVTKDLAYYLTLEYPYTVTPDEDEWFVNYPDLSGCMTVVEAAADIPAMAQEIKELWLETALEEGFDIPEPVTAEYSGKFVLRLPKSLHQSLAHRAEQEGTSLNSYVVHLLGERASVSTIQQQLVEQMSAVTQQMAAMSAAQTYSVEFSTSEDEVSSMRRNKLRVVSNAVAV